MYGIEDDMSYLRTELNNTQSELENCRDKMINTEDTLRERENELYRLRDEVEALRHVLACQKTYKVTREKFNTYGHGTMITPNDPYLVAFLKAEEKLKAALFAVGETLEEV
jgi:chromosome segregation ATPase